VSARGLILALAVVPFLAACALPSRKAAADANAKAAFADCEAERQAHRGGVTDHADAVDCAVPRVTSAYGEAAYPYPDLVYVRLAARFFGAERVDAGSVTEAEYEREVAELDDRVLAEERRRADSTRFGGAGKQSPTGALLDGLPALAFGSPADLPRNLGLCFSLDPGMLSIACRNNPGKAPGN